MPLSKHQADRLYEIEEAVEKPAETASHKVSNLDLILAISRGAHPEQMAAAVFLRPRMAMRYSLLPALARQFSQSRPVENLANPATKRKERLRRSLALVLELADENWTELPRAWCYLGSALETGDMELVRDAIAAILDRATVKKPMEFLDKFAQIPADNTAWQRFYRLSDADLEEFANEREITLQSIEEEDESA